MKETNLIDENYPLIEKSSEVIEKKNQFRAKSKFK